MNWRGVGPSAVGETLVHQTRLICPQFNEEPKHKSKTRPRQPRWTGLELTHLLVFILCSLYQIMSFLGTNILSQRRIVNIEIHWSSLIKGESGENQHFMFVSCTFARMKFRNGFIHKIKSWLSIPGFLEGLIPLMFILYKILSIHSQRAQVL